MPSLKTTLTELIANFSLLMVPLFLATRFFRKYARIDSIGKRLFVGSSAGLLGTVLMIFTVQIDGSILDFRQFAIILSSVFGGFLSSLITGMILFAMRLALFPPISAASVTAAANTLAIAIIVGLLAKKVRNYWDQWVWSLVAASVLTGTVFVVNQGWSGFMPALIYFTMMVAGGIPFACIVRYFLLAKERLDNYKFEATKDFLTGLNNNRKFAATFNALIRHAENRDKPLSVVLIDIDYFKQVNDSHGHMIGDSSLKQLADILRDTVRPTDTVSRNGGEEFSVLMLDTPHRTALDVAERIRTAVEHHPIELNNGKKLHITVSIGVSSYPETELDRLFIEADYALYQAKAMGRNNVRSNQNPGKTRSGAFGKSI